MSSVEDYMNTKMVMRDSKASVLELAKVMVDWSVSSVVITDEENNKKVIGILTERDIVKSIAKGVPPDGITAGSLMSSPILSIRKDQPIEEAALLMIRNKVRHLLVEDPTAADNGAIIIGIITMTNLARYLKKRMKETTIASAVREEDEKERQAEQRESSSKLLLSEAWELYF